MKRNKENFAFLVVGTNFISDTFADAVNLLDKIEISAVLSRKRETGEAFAAKHGIRKTLLSLEEAYQFFCNEQGFDGVYLATPNALHIPQSEFFLERGIPVFCEKPAAPDEKTVERAIQAAKKSDTVFMEAMRPAHDPAIEEIRRAIAEITPVRSVRLEFSQYSSRYDRFLNGEAVNTFNRSLANAALLDLGIYAVSCALMLFGEPEGEILSRSVFLGNGFEASGQALLSYPGFVLSLVYSKICEGASPSVILGERGSLTIDRLSEPRKVLLKLRGSELQTLCLSAPKNNMIFEISDFIRICRERNHSEAVQKEYEHFLQLTRSQCRLLEKIETNSGIRFD